RVPAAGRAALDAEDRAEAGLAQAEHDAAVAAPERVGKPHRHGGLAFARGRRVDPGHEHQLRGLPVLGALRDGAQVHLGLVAAVVFDIVLAQAEGLGDLTDRTELCRLGDLDVGLHGMLFRSGSGPCGSTANRRRKMGRGALLDKVVAWRAGRIPLQGKPRPLLYTGSSNTAAPWDA